MIMVIAYVFMSVWDALLGVRHRFERVMIMEVFIQKLVFDLTSSRFAQAMLVAPLQGRFMLEMQLKPLSQLTRC